MEIKIPFGNRRSSKVLLKNVLYAKDMGVTLVSISHITVAGHKAVFDGLSLKIFNSMKKLLEEIPVSKGLYHVEHTESAHTVMETVTVNDLHRQMGYIAPDAAKLLVKKGIVEGIHLDETQSICTCNSCEFTKTSHKAIKHERVAECADNSNTTQTLEYTKDKYNVKIIKQKVSSKVSPTTYVDRRIKERRCEGDEQIVTIT
jgi:hypothetical protein